MSNLKPALFGAFSSLSQIIHEGDHKFVVISYSNDPEDPLRDELPHLDDLPMPKDDAECVIFEVGEVGGMNRWWHGIWTLDDVKRIAGPRGTDISYGRIVGDAAQHFVEGYSSISNLVPVPVDSQQTQPSQSQPSQDLSSHMGPSLRIDTKTDVATITIPLFPLSPIDGASRGNQILWTIVSQTALNQDACLFPSRRPTTSGDGATVGGVNYSPSKAQDDVQKAELEKQVKELRSELKKHNKDANAPPPIMPAGRSLGNPTKKARKVQTAEFADDSEEEKPVKSKKRKTKA